jgi:hypothetical protein
MDAETTTEQVFQESFDNIVVLEPRSFYSEDHLIMPGEFDIA